MTTRETPTSATQGMYGHWTRERVIEAIQDYAHQYGRTPGAQDWNVAMARANGRPDLVERFYDDACWPHTATLLYVFGSFNAAIAAAGFEPRKPGKRGATSEYAKTNGRGHAAKTHCKYGHPLSGENLYVFGGQRVCKACHARRKRECLARKKSQVRS